MTEPEKDRLQRQAAEDLRNSTSQSLPIMTPMPATAAQRALWEREDRVRALFVSSRADAQLDDPHVLLTDVYAHADRFVYAPEDADEHAVPKLLTRFRNHATSGANIRSRAAFDCKLAAFTAFGPNFDWSNVFMAGGGVLACLASSERDDSMPADAVARDYDDSDIDLFIYGITSKDEATRCVKRICDQIAAATATATAKDDSKPLLVRTARTVTIVRKLRPPVAPLVIDNSQNAECFRYPLRHVQIILRLYRSPAEILLGFDIDVCSGTVLCFRISRSVIHFRLFVVESWL